MAERSLEDREADYFAMCLLMPEAFVRRELARMGGVELSDDKALRLLARKFAVSLGLMALRLGQLGLA